MLLETYTALDEASLRDRLPKFLNIEKEVTGNPDYSMFNLSLREDWKTSKKFWSSPMGKECELLIKCLVHYGVLGPEDLPSQNKETTNGIDCKVNLTMNGQHIQKLNGKV